MVKKLSDNAPAPLYPALFKYNDVARMIITNIVFLLKETVYLAGTPIMIVGDPIDSILFIL